jgi:pyridoxal phosphate enzyme (YggS family)
MSAISDNLQVVRMAIVEAAHAAGRDAAAVQLLAVSKNFGPDDVVEAAANGQVAFGENYLQEALDKIAAVQALQPGLALSWHFIGPIQGNKTRQIASHFDWVHAVDREKIAQRLSDQRPKGLPPLNVCLQVNISGEASKSGVAPEDVSALAHKVLALPGLRLRGLMAMPEPAQDREQQRAPFARMGELLGRLRAEGLRVDTLSMGMSGDLAAAVAEGSTIVRIGTAIFGHRNYEQ